MRLIDADALKEEICKRYFHFSQRLAISAVFESIANAHTIDAVPAREGRWIAQKGGGYCCSECGNYAVDGMYGAFVYVSMRTRFCPTCGADMRGSYETD